MFVMTNVCCNKHNFMATKVLWQQKFCCDKNIFVVTSILLILAAVPTKDKNALCKTVVTPTAPAEFHTTRVEWFCLETENSATWLPL